MVEAESTEEEQMEGMAFNEFVDDHLWDVVLSLTLLVALTIAPVVVMIWTFDAFSPVAGAFYAVTTTIWLMFWFFVAHARMSEHRFAVQVSAMMSCVWPLAVLTYLSGIHGWNKVRGGSQ